MQRLNKRNYHSLKYSSCKYCNCLKELTLALKGDAWQGVCVGEVELLDKCYLHHLEFSQTCLECRGILFWWLVQFYLRRISSLPLGSVVMTHKLLQKICNHLGPPLLTSRVTLKTFGPVLQKCMDWCINYCCHSAVTNEVKIFNAFTINRSLAVTTGVIGVASYGSRDVPPFTSNCLIFLVTPDPHKLWHWILCGCQHTKNI